MKYSTIVFIVFACFAFGSIADAQPALLPTTGLTPRAADNAGDNAAAVLRSQAGGSFLFEVIGDTALSGSPNDILTAHGRFSNSSLEAVRIEMIRRINDLPSTWATSICLDVCYPEFLDSTSFFLEPGTSQDFSLYFYTTDDEGTGTVLMEFRNADEPMNNFRQVFTGTTGGTSVRGLPVAAVPNITLYPNPARAGSDLYLAIESETPTQLTSAVLYSLDGRKLRTFSLAQGPTTRIQTAGLPPGSYMMILNDRFGAIRRAGFILR